MSGIETWGDAITMSMINLGQKVIGFLPVFIGALFVFVAGWIVAVVLESWWKKH